LEHNSPTQTKWQIAQEVRVDSDPWMAVSK
jgi:hypothetical protein